VVNQTLANRYFGRENPIGGHIRVGFPSTAREKIPEPVFEIVGVVADIRNRGMEEPTVPEVFFPYTITNIVFHTILIRTSVEPRKVIAAVRNELRTMNKNTRQEPAPLDDFIAKYSYAQPRFSAFLMGVFAGIGLLLVGTGIYGVMAYAVSQQTREIGIRMALGAEQSQVFREVFGVATRLIGLGLIGGILASFLTNHLIATQVWTGATAFDPVVLLAGVGTIVALGLAACYVPALRATRVQPLVALRHE
jgi:ABC-type antimicrobial peptide transport system permease subunit